MDPVRARHLGRILALALLSGGVAGAAPGKLAVKPVKPLPLGGQVQLEVKASGDAAGKPVTWSIAGQGNGTVDESGLYRAPATHKTPATISIRVELKDDPKVAAKVSASLAAISVTAKADNASIPLGGITQVEAKVANGEGVKFAVEGGGTIDEKGIYTAPSSGKTPAKVTVKVTSIQDPSKTAKVALTLAAISVTAKADKASIPLGGFTQVEAKVANGEGVRFAVEGGGTIDEKGIYSAPSSGKTPAKVTVKVTSVQDPSKSATTNIGIERVAVAIEKVANPVLVGGSVELAAKVSGALASLGSVTWSLATPGAGSVDAHGHFAAPTEAKTPTAISVRATSTADSSKSATYAVPIAAVSVAIEPKQATVPLAGDATFSARVAGADASDQKVNWTVEGGDKNGTIDAAGHFRAPDHAQTPLKITIRATAVADPSKSASATVDLRAVKVNAHAPAEPVALGANAKLEAHVENAIAPVAGVSWQVVTAKGGTIDPDGTFHAPEQMHTPATITIRATSVADPSKSATVQLQFRAVAVEIAQKSLAVPLGGSAELSASVSGVAGAAEGVTWSLEGPGSIDERGHFAPPANAHTPASTTARAQSKADPSKSAAVRIEIPAVEVAISPARASVELGASTKLAAQVKNALGDAQKVNWSVVGEGNGTIDPDGTYHAPTQGKTPATIKVRAVSEADSSKVAEAEIAWPAVAVSLAPGAGRVRLGEKLALSSNVGNATDREVTYSVDGAAGTVSPDGTFTAAALLPEPPVAKVTARAKADPSKAATISVELALNQVYSVAGERRVSGGQPGSLPAGAPTRGRVVVDGKRVAVAFVDGQTLLVAVSEDRGATFKAPVKMLSGRPIAAPILAVGPDHALYVAFRSQPKDQPADVLVCRTPDLQHAFEPCVKANAQPIARPGEHAFAVARDGTVYVAWSDGAGVTLARSNGRLGAFSSQSVSAPGVLHVALAAADDGAALLADATADHLEVRYGRDALVAIPELEVHEKELGAIGIAGHSQQEVAVAYVEGRHIVLERPHARSADFGGADAQQDAPALALDGEGLQLAWREVRPDGQGVFLLRAPRDLELSKPMAVGTFGPAIRGAPSIAVDRSGRGFIAWTDGRAGDAQGRHQDVYLARADEHPVHVEVSGGSKPLLAGQTAQLTAKVTGAANGEVRWSVDDGAGRGSVDGRGLYTAPAHLSGSPHVYVRATSVADPSRSAAALVELAPQPEISSIAPASCGIGETVVISGHHFGARYPGFGVSFGGVRAQESDYASWDDDKIAVRVPAGANSGALEVSNAGGTARASEPFTFLPVAIAVSPDYAVLAAGQHRAFNASVLHAGDTRVRWTLADPAAAALSVDGDLSVDAHAEKVRQTTLRATSRADDSRSAEAKVITGPLGGTVWQVKLAGAHGPVLAGSRIIAVGKDGTARAFDRDGMPLWSTQVVSVVGAEGAPPQLRTPIAAGSRAFIAVQLSGSCAEGRACQPDSGELVALDLENGAIAWRVELGDGDFTDAVAFPGGVAVARYAGALVAFHADSGKKLWAATLPKGLSTPPVFGPDGELHGTGDGGVIYSVSVHGKVAPAASFAGKPTSVSRPAVEADGAIFVASDDGLLRKVDDRGRVIWKAQLDGRVPPRTDTAPVLTADALYVATTSTLEAFSLDGTRKWKQSCGACAGPILRGPDGTLYAGRYGPQAFSATGELLWAADAPNEGDRWSPGALTPDGLLLWTDAHGLSALIAGSPAVEEQARSGNAESASSREATAR